MTDENQLRIDSATVGVDEDGEIALIIVGEGFTEDVSVVLGGEAFEAEVISANELRVVAGEGAVGQGLVHVELVTSAGDIIGADLEIGAVAEPSAEAAFEYPEGLPYEAEEEFDATGGLPGNGDEEK
jgi:hypothetical protein